MVDESKPPANGPPPQAPADWHRHGAHALRRVAGTPLAVLIFSSALATLLLTLYYAGGRAADVSVDVSFPHSQVAAVAAVVDETVSTSSPVCGVYYKLSNCGYPN